MTRPLALLAALALAAGCRKPDPPAAPPPLDGTYLLVGQEAEGVRWAEPDLAARPAADRTVVIAGTKMTTRAGGAEAVSTLKLDPSKSPPQVDVTAPGVDGKPVTVYGIYQVEDGVLTICAAPGDPKQRPAEFRADGRAVLARYRKQ